MADDGATVLNGGDGSKSNGNGAVTPDGPSSTGESGTVRLQRTVGLGSGMGMILGVIIGSGIFVSPKGVLVEVHSVGLSLVVWAVCGVIALIGAHSFAELGTMIVKAGGLYNYIQDSFGNLAAFVYLWASLVIVFPAANAAIALVFADNILEPVFSTCDKPAVAVRLIAACAIAVLTYLNCASMKWATWVQNVFTIVKILALVLIIITGLVLLCMGNTINFQNAFEGSNTNPGSIVLAFYSGMFSYSGWYTLNFLVEELKKPERNLPWAIWFSMPIVTLIYVLTNVAYLAVLSPQELISSDAVAVTFSERVYGWGSVIMPVLVAFSTFGSLNGCILSIARMFFVGAREGQLPAVLANIHIKQFTPVPAILFEGVLSILFLLAKDVFQLIYYVSFVESLSFVACTAGLLYLRWKYPEWKRPIKVNLFFPIVFLIVCVLLTLIPVYYTPNDVLVGILICLSAVPVYWIGVCWKTKPRSFVSYVNRMTILAQKVCYSVPQEEKID